MALETVSLAPRLCLLLAGGPKPAPLAMQTGCSVLDLSLTRTKTVLELWAERLGAIAGEERPLEVSVIQDAQSPEPTLDIESPGLTLSRRVEQRRYRGPVGLAKDECESLEDDALILLAEAGRLPACGLDRFVRDHVGNGSDITVGANPDRSPAGVYLFARRALDLVPSRGFMDLKEQWLPKALNSGLAVRVHVLDAPGVLPLRTKDLFSRAVRILNDLPDPLESTLDPLIGSEPSTGIRRSVVAETATIAPDAVVIDSVIMTNATIGSRAIVARSLVCPRCVVPPDQTIVDTVLARGAYTSRTRGPMG